ncbi:MAG: hypothetical protein FWD09_06425 [Lentimicrobiaceae bacterium]|nr:hypothetical protein [Lentimicrobiaceae bacterium]
MMMKNIILLYFFFLPFFGDLLMTSAAQGSYNEYLDDEEIVRKKDLPWKRKGFEFYIGAGLYFGDGKTAIYYNGAPENSINLNNLLKNEYHRQEVFDIIRRAYPYLDQNSIIELDEVFNQKTGYSMAMDISLSVKYRIQKNFYLDLSYSFRRLSSENRFIFNFPEVPLSNITKPYSNWQYLIAKEDRHYIDLSAGYILQKHAIVKPFISLGLLFTYIRIHSFLAIIEGVPFDLMYAARYPNWTPGTQEMPIYWDWAGPGFGMSLTAGLKIAFSRTVSIDPVFQLSIASFGNGGNLPHFNTSPCFNYMAGIRLVMNDELFSRNK